MFNNEQQQLLWDDLRVVLALARSGSLTRAAQELGSSHPTVFRRIHAIERTVGASLFIRSRQGYRPTEAASPFIALAERIDADIRQLPLAGAPTRDALAGKVSLTVAPVFMHTLLPPILTKLQQQLPNVQLEVSSSYRLFDLSRHEADIALRSGGEAPEHLVGKRLCSMAVAVYQPRAWAAVSQRTWKSRPWITPDASFSQQASVAWLKEEGMFERAVARCDNIVHVALLADAGAGMAVLPCYLGDVMPGLRRVGAPVPDFRSDLWLLWHPQWRGVKRIGAVVEQLSREIAEKKRLIEGECPAPA